MIKLNNKQQLSRIKLNGYKSIFRCDLELGSLNVLIGSNGAGKSNFIGFFKMIGQIVQKSLQLHVGRAGGPDALLHFGKKHTKSLSTELYFGESSYLFTLEATEDNRMMFANEAICLNGYDEWKSRSGHFESEACKMEREISKFALDALKSWRVYHFHDTSNNSPMKLIREINDNIHLRADGANLAAFLYLLNKKYEKNYMRIVKAIRLVAPFFGDFILRPTPLDSNSIELEWRELDEDMPFKAFQLSDGTLRFIALATLLLQPEELQPETIFIDEPELGLHPFALEVLAGLLKSCSTKKQIIISTQSVELLSHFNAMDVIVVNRKNGASEIKRVSVEDLDVWLEDYTLGELWNKNILGGRPSK